MGCDDGPVRWRARPVALLTRASRTDIFHPGAAALSPCDGWPWITGGSPGRRTSGLSLPNIYLSADRSPHESHVQIIALCAPG